MKWFGRTPAMWSAAVLAVVQLVAVLAHLQPGVQNALSVIVTGLFTIAVAVFTRPVDFSVVTGTLATIATAVGAFGLHISADTVSTFNAALVAVASLILTTLVSPSPALGGPVTTRVSR